MSCRLNDVEATLLRRSLVDGNKVNLPVTETLYKHIFKADFYSQRSLWIKCPIVTRNLKQICIIRDEAQSIFNVSNMEIRSSNCGLIIAPVQEASFTV